MSVDINNEAQVIEIRSKVKDFFVWMCQKDINIVRLERDGAELKISFGDYPEGCTPADAKKLREFNHSLADRVNDLEETLKIAVTKIIGEHDPIGWPIDRFIDVIEGRPFR